MTDSNDPKSKGKPVAEMTAAELQSTVRAAAKAGRVEFSPSDEMEQLEHVAVPFYRDVLALDYGAGFHSDESSLSDYATCGLPDAIADTCDTHEANRAAWEPWVIDCIERRYGFRLTSVRIRMVDLLREVEAATTHDDD